MQPFIKNANGLDALAKTQLAPKDGDSNGKTKPSFRIDLGKLNSSNGRLLHKKNPMHVDTPTILSPYGTLKLSSSAQVSAYLNSQNSALGLVHGNNESADIRSGPGTRNSFLPLPGRLQGALSSGKHSDAQKASAFLQPLSPGPLLKMPPRPQKYRLLNLRGCGPPAAPSSCSSGSMHSGALSTIPEHTHDHDVELFAEGEMSSKKLDTYDYKVPQGRESINVSRAPQHYEASSAVDFNQYEQSPLCYTRPPAVAYSPSLPSLSLGSIPASNYTPIQQVPELAWNGLRHRGNYLRKSLSLPTPGSSANVANENDSTFDAIAKNFNATSTNPPLMPAVGKSMLPMYLKAPTLLSAIAGPSGPFQMNVLQAPGTSSAPSSARISSTQLMEKGRLTSASSQSSRVSSLGETSHYGMRDWRLQRQKDRNLTLPASLPSLSQQELEEKVCNTLPTTLVYSWKSLKLTLIF